MARSSWSGVDWKGLTWRGRSTHRKGLILGGGGARASFHIGALEYLYDHADLAPTGFVGTSAGSILAGLLAQYAEPSRQREALAQFAELWLGMTDSAQMFTERAWFHQLVDRAPQFRTIFDDVAPQPARPEPVDTSEVLPGANLDPEEPMEAAGWSPSLVLRLVGALPSLRRAGGDLPQIARGFGHARSLYRAGPVMRHIMELFDQRLLGASGNLLRIAIVQLDDGELYYVTESGGFVDRTNAPVDYAQQPLTLAVRASCTVPGTLIPVEMAGREWVDGGVRENLPVEMGLGRLQLADAWVVNVMPPHLPHAEPNDVMSIMMRAVEILSNEALRDEVAYAQSAGARIVQPELDIHDTVTIIPGLLRLNRDYGWIRAREAHSEAKPTTVDRHRNLIADRLRAFWLESELLGMPQPVPLGEAAPQPRPYGGTSDPRHMELALLKYRIMEQVAACDAADLPPGASEWGRGWEYHLTETPTPWWRMEV